MGHAFLRAPKFVTFASPQALQASVPTPYWPFGPFPPDRGESALFRGSLRCASGWEVVIDGDRRVQARGGGCVQEEQAAGVLQVEYNEIRFGTQDADARDAAIRVIGDCDGAAFVQIVGQGDLSGVRVDAP